MKNILDHAASIEGSYAALARAMGLSKQRVQAWKKSLPEAWRIVLRSKYARRKPKPVNQEESS